MPQETRTSTTKITFRLADSLRKKFNRHCKKLNVSVAQRLRDPVSAIQKILNQQLQQQIDTTRH